MKFVYALLIGWAILCQGTAEASIQTFSYTGSDQFYVVPAGVIQIEFKLWGAGGGGAGSAGGGGGFTAGIIDTIPGEVLTIVVGQGGQFNGAATYGGGGASTFSFGSGGGLSGVHRSGEYLIIAGAGGGASNSTGPGGAGGGLVGQAGSGSFPPGGGTQTSGGVGGTGNGLDGGFLFGGSAVGGGGGSGYYGGGGGSTSGANGGGGGGSALVPVGGMTSGGILTSPGGALDPDYLAGIGVGGANGSHGGNGLVVISQFTTSAVPEPLSVFVWGGLAIAAAAVATRRSTAPGAA